MSVASTFTNAFRLVADDAWLAQISSATTTEHDISRFKIYRKY